jgi:hypothetical protein
VFTSKIINISCRIYEKTLCCSAVLFTIQLGSKDLTTADSNRQTVATSDWVVHPDFNPDSIENDIGLIQLRLPVTLTGK